MTDDTRVSGTVAIEADSRAKVALDLMKQISHFEQIDRQQPRRYWLELYRDCLSVVHHGQIDKNLIERPQ